MAEIRPIDANALKEEIINSGYILLTPELISTYIDNAPTINKTEQNVDEKCKTCKYYLYGFESYPCAHCQRNFKLADEIREQQNDFWKDGTPK